eukprot:81641-Chlamydomonas_euryale.AAC.3
MFISQQGNYNKVAKDMDRQLAALGGARLVPLALGDEDAGDTEQAFRDWSAKVVNAVNSAAARAAYAAAAVGTGAEEEDAFDAEGLGDDDADDADGGSDSESEAAGASAEVDMEDIAGAAPRKGQATAAPSGAGGDKRDMLTPMLRTSLTKQGYKLIGSHSGVKMCRWTKSMLRGRGGCYKHAFYGVAATGMGQGV